VITVVEAGPLATVQDLGRHGYQHLGVGVAGAADAASAALANRLVGNPADAACIEVTMGGLHVELRAAAVLALTGAVCATTVHGGPAVGFGAPAALAARTRLALATPLDGLRTYLAVRGGIDVPRVLGSRSLDTLGGVGPPRLQPGDALPIGGDPGTPIDTDVAPLPPLHATFRLWPGPRADWFADALDHLMAPGWTVGADSNRVGVRLEGAPLVRAHRGELASEPLVTGAVQVPHDGLPIVMLADHPVTGGYPVVAVVDPADVAMVAQARPGTTVRFVTARPARPQ
jgi:biotin-dependent carboxylase-like uncharacterized protein